MSVLYSILHTVCFWNFQPTDHHAEILIAFVVSCGFINLKEYKASTDYLSLFPFQQYLEQAQDLVFNENVLLQTLGFDVAIDHPHTHVVRCCHLVRGKCGLGPMTLVKPPGCFDIVWNCEDLTHINEYDLLFFENAP